ncbi:pentatricopeptide repeat-containing protein At1g71210, mitochondrial [Magnolia sinica]|uniref:pentatricopeptide repeat-containing protein At1g71210, mitochondrial n=1 Tax=Magnolia sinica TaxID=86752 RepID=UPI00265915BD|nr:pentatricopeptide repeat-containing protein At1g71210, mitochondrial [Magnolia sinica]
MLKYAAVRCLLSPIVSHRLLLISTFSSSFHLPFLPSIAPSVAPDNHHLDLDPKDIASSFKEWFRSRDEDDSLFDLIFKILTTHDDSAAGPALSRLGLYLSEPFVIRVLRHGRSDVLPCLKFFDWAGRQPGFRHTRATYHAIFKILSQARLMSVMLDWLRAFAHQTQRSRVRFFDTLVMGYAVAGKLEVALQLFGRMRFQGLDLDIFTYHVLLNALVEEKSFDVVDVVSRQITMRGLENDVTCCIRMKNLCKQNRLDEAELYLRELETNHDFINEHILSVLVEAHCKQKKFEKACGLIEEFGKSGKVRMGPAYRVWIQELIHARQVDTAMDFFHSKSKMEGYVPEVFCYNMLICGLLIENRLDEVYDLFVEMREGRISPDKLTMNAALCFFCKAGMVDVAIELYTSRLEIGLTPNSLAFNCLINALVGDGSTDEACHVLEDSLKQGYFPGKRTFNILADALCREGKLDKMNKLVDIALQRNIKPSNAVCVQYISALCKAGRAEEGYMVPVKFNQTGSVLNRYTYVNLIRGFSNLRRGDMALRLLLEMQESGHVPTRSLYRAVIGCLCELGNLDQVLNLLDIQLSCHKHDRRIYNYFIGGAGHGRKPELAREVLERMVNRGIQPNIETNILMLQSYLKSKRIADALNFFNDLCKKQEPSNRLYNIMIVGLCQAGRPELALMLWEEVREKGIIPSLHCYEELVHVLCTAGNYDMVVKVLKDFEETGRQVSSFICNVLLLHTLKNRELNRAWVQSGDIDGAAAQSRNLMLGQLVGAFSGGIRMKEHLDNLEEVVEQFFPVDIYTYNMIVRALTMEGRMDYACELFNRIRKKGYEPNRWTYDIIVHGFCKHGRRKDAERWMKEMYHNGFYPTWCTIEIYNNMEINI